MSKKQMNSKFRLRGLAMRFYHRVPHWFRWILSPLTLSFRFLRKARPKFWIVEGKELVSQKTLSILCAASEEDRSYLAGLAFGEDYCEHCHGRAWLWNAKAMHKRTGSGYSMMFITVRPFWRKLLGAGEWFYVPAWVNGVFDSPLESTIKSTESIRSDIRRIRREALGFEITQEAQRFDDFYYNMYVPYVTKAHGRSAYIDSYEDMKKNKFGHCDLLLVTKQQESIAGILILYLDTGPRIGSVGIRGGDLKYLKQGAMGALYYFSLQYLEDKGPRKVGCGSSRAFLRDGVLQYKKKWAQRLMDVPSTTFALKILSCTDATQAFLENNPFIIDDNGSLYGAVFLNIDKQVSPKDLEKIDKKYSYPGLLRLIVHLFPGKDGLKSTTVPPGLSERITLAPMDRMIGEA